MDRTLVIAALWVVLAPPAASGAPPEREAALAAAAQLHALVTSATGPVRARAEVELGAALERAGLPFAAVVYLTPLVKAGPRHPGHLEAVAAVVRLQEALGDDVLVPSLLNNTYDRHAEAWRRLPPESLARINYLIGRVAHRRGQLEEARQFLEAVPRSSRTYARARALLGVTLGDPRYPGSEEAARQGRREEALEAFRAALAAEPDRASPVHQLALLGLGRVSYDLGRPGDAARAYEQVPSSSRFWDQALLEGALARFQDDDPGGALGALHGLAAPQLGLAFQPEAPILASTIYFFACLHGPARSELRRFEVRYAPMEPRLRELLEEQPPARLLEELRAGRASRLPPPVVAWVRSSQRIEGLLDLLAQVAKETSQARAQASWAAEGLGPEVLAALAENQAMLEQLAEAAVRARLTEAARSLRGFADQAEVLRFELAKAEQAAAESGLDRRALLDAQPLLAPRAPSDQVEAWRFQGESWRDELGSYRFTLRRGCEAQR